MQSITVTLAKKKVGVHAAFREFGCRIRILVLFCLIGAAAGCGDPLENRSNEQYNILLVSIDTLRADHVGAYGYNDISTPNIDRLASEGVLFEKAYTPCPITLPAHTSLMTGTYPVFHGVRNNGIAHAGDSLTTIAEVLDERGYDTCAVIGAIVLDSSYGLDQGFDEYDDAIPYSTDGLNALFYPERKAEEVTQQSFAFLNRKKSKSPFFLWVHYFDPHNIYRPPEPFAGQYPDNPYDGEIAYVDSEIGSLIEMLKITGYYEDTIIVLTSDHGEGLKEHDEYTHGLLVYDSTLHVPLIISNPRLIKSPMAIKDPVSLIDVMPTLLDILNIDRKEAACAVQGISLVPLMSGKSEKPREMIYFETLLPYFDYDWAGLCGIRTGNWKFIQAPGIELYDTETDTNEMNNLYEENKDVADKLRKSLELLVSRHAAEVKDNGKARIDPEDRMKLSELGYASGAQHEKIEGNPFEGTDPKQKTHIVSRLSRANELFKLGNYSGSMKLLQEAYQEDPHNPNVLSNLGSLNADMGRLSESARYYETLLERKPGDTTVRNSLGMIYTRQGMYKKAAETFEKTLEIDPEHVDAMFNLAIIYNNRGDYGKAEAGLKRVVELQPNFVNAYNNLGSLYADQGKYLMGIECYRQALSIKPDFAKAHYNCAKTYFMLKEYRKAGLHLKQALHLGADVDPGFVEELGSRMK